MKIVVINASPRKRGNTEAVIDLITAKLSALGNIEFEIIVLSDMDLKMCRGCVNCLLQGESYCPNQKDDREMIEEKILSADGVILASPVYAMNMTAIMKNFMDRFAFSMHRPRFFNQKTMVVAVTGVVGLKETIDSISQLEFSGFNIVQKLGVVAQNPLTNPSFSDIKKIKKIEKQAEEFYKKIVEDKPIKPSLKTVLAFKVQQKTFAKNKDVSIADWKYFSDNGWFEPKCDYYTQNADVSLLKKGLATLLVNLVSL